MNETARRIDSIRDRIRQAAARSGRNPGEIAIVAVTKTVTVDRILPAINAGIRLLGENYIQEAMEKIGSLPDQLVAWHFIGHLQSKKVKYAVRHFDLIHSVDSLKLAREIDKEAAKAGKVQRILIQVNIAEEATKSGISADDTLELVREAGRCEHLQIEGLMTMPPFFDDPARARPFFRALSELKDRVQAAGIPNVIMKELSMGMTGDLEAAVEEGATMVRIGTAIFGERL